jgi:DMSO/TMAO reductase YedYZ molybdopterin-dependent catalytic subunit
MAVGFLRRDLLLRSAAVGSVALLQGRAFAQVGQTGGKLIPWIDQPPPVPVAAKAIKSLTPWEDLDSWTTPNDKFFAVSHYNLPEIDEKTWQLEIAGSISKPLTFTLDELKMLPRHEVISTIECAGSNGLPFFTSAIGNARWAGASLAEILKRAQIKDDALEVVFFGADEGEEVLRKGTPLELKFSGNFARSMSIEDAMNPANLVCYEMNGTALPKANGFPVRLITPGWFGVANVKWLRRIEVRNTRFMGRFMGRDYVTVREEKRNGETIAVETSVDRLLLKSAPARVTQQDGRSRITGMAWGPSPIAAVEVKIDGEPWRKAALDDDKSKFAWRFWHLDWSPSPGEHTVTSRAIDQIGNIQPAPNDPSIANKKTYWESNAQITRRIRIA